jgi:hypothetical protein
MDARGLSGMAANLMHVGEARAGGDSRHVLLSQHVADALGCKRPSTAATLRRIDNLALRALLETRPTPPTPESTAAMERALLTCELILVTRAESPSEVDAARRMTFVTHGVDGNSTLCAFTTEAAAHATLSLPGAQAWTTPGLRVFEFARWVLRLPVLIDAGSAHALVLPSAQVERLLRY